MAVGVLRAPRAPSPSNVTGNIRTSGGGAHGIFAQSAGGGAVLPPPGGLTAAATGLRLGRDVTITMNGRVEASGQDAHGILAHSAGGDGNGNIAITVGPGGLVSGGRKGPNNNGAGIMLIDGAANTVTNAGTITSVDKIAIAHTGQGKVHVDNTGTIDGDVLIPSGGQVTNRPGAAVRADVVDLGGGALQNDGTILPGGHGQVGVTRINGTLTQGPSGVLAIDVDPRNHGAANHADLLTVRGRRASAARSG